MTTTELPFLYRVRLARECNPGNAAHALPTDSSDALHVTLSCRKPKTLQEAWSLRPFALIASAEAILRAAMILQHMGNPLDLHPLIDLKAVTFTKSHALACLGDATVVCNEWTHRWEVGQAQTAIRRCDEQIAELTHNRGLWEERLAKLLKASQ